MTTYPGRVKVYCDALLAYIWLGRCTRIIRLHAMHGVKHHVGPDRADTWYL